MKEIKEKILSLLAEASGIDTKDIPPPEIPPKSDMGDLAVGCFPLAQKLHKKPDDIARELAQNFPENKVISKVESAGPYINFHLNWAYLSDDILSGIFHKSSNQFSSTEGHNKTVVIDLSSPNIAKPFGIGHLRSTNIGSTLGRLFELQGYKVVRINHLGDWGTQFGKLITAFKRWGNEEELKEQPVRYLYNLYVRIHREEKSDSRLEDEGRLWFKKLEDGDEEALNIWKLFKQLSLEEFKRIYNLLGIEFESYAGESFYNDMLDDLIEELITMDLAVESDGALIVDLSDYDMPPCLLRKKDGATLYATRDICAALYRHETYRFDRMLYVVGAPQALHFRQFFKVLELMGHDWVNRCEHISFGHMRFRDRSMSTRKGNIIFIEDVFTEATNLIEGIIHDKNPGLADIQSTAQSVGIGAVLFGDLKTRRHKEVIFDWNEILNPDGETGPYVQYTYARFSSILRKSGEQVTIEARTSILTQPEEIDTLRCLTGFEESIAKALASREPQVLTTYLIDLCTAANRFHRKCRVLIDDKELREARLLLVYAVKAVLARGLHLLGMAAPEEM